MLEAMPKREEVLGLPAKIVSPEVAAANIRRIKEMLDGPVHDFVPAPVTVEHDPRTLAEVEADLHRHYADRKSAAAGEG